MRTKELLRKLRENEEGLALKLLNKAMEQVFIQGQESEKKILSRINRFKLKKRYEREKEHQDIAEDVLKEMVEQMKEDLPCSKLLGVNSCKYKLSTLGHIDRFCDALFERIENRIRENENQLEQGKLFD